MTTWLNTSKIDKLRKLELAEELIEGGHSDRLLDLVGTPTDERPKPQAALVRREPTGVSVQRGRDKSQTSWLDRPGMDARRRERQAAEAQGVHYHAPGHTCPIRDCKLNRQAL